ncbi:MAG TPA: tetratricopeptide repeat protein [bacterium]
MPVFLFTDIEESAQKWERFPASMKSAIERHNELLRSTIEKHGGEIIKNTGDGFFAVFEGGAPLQAALDIQTGIQKTDWKELGELRVRVGMHAGFVEKKGEDYFGPIINRTARIMSVAWGGQIVLTPQVSQVAGLPPHATIVDLGLHVLKDLSEPQSLYGLLHPDLVLKEFPPLRSLSQQPNNLPLQTTPFLGREEELPDITKLLASDTVRLVTIIGPGGIGKTRLALQAAAEAIEHFRHGVYLIGLAPLDRPELVISAIANAVKFSFYSGKDEKEQLFDFLREKEILLIMDNFEHLLSAVTIVGEILKAADKVKILVTSRELLNLKGEWLMQIAGMKVPSGDAVDIEGYSAIQLFMYNAQRVNAQDTFSDEEKKSIVRICQLIAGMPLGIEIASSWLRTLSCQEIAQEIEKNIDFLTTSMRDVPERHRSVRAIFDYSWNLIGPEEKKTLARLSVFRSSFAREAAQEIGQISLPALVALVDKSLLRKNASGRYEWIDILRQYAFRKLAMDGAEHDSTMQRFARYYAQYLATRQQEIDKKSQLEIMADLDLEIENIRAALNWALEKNNRPVIVDSLAAYASYTATRGFYLEGEQNFKRICELLKPDAENLARATSRYAVFLTRLGNFDKARVLLHESVAYFPSHRNDPELAYASNAAGNVENVLGNYDDALPHYKTAQDCFQSVGDKYGLIGCLNNIGVIHYRRGQWLPAKETFQKCLAMSRELDFEKGKATAAGNLGLVEIELGNFDEAVNLLQESLEFDRKLHDPFSMANATHNLGFAYKALEMNARAQEYYQKSLEMRKMLGDHHGVALSYNSLGSTAMALKDYPRAIGLLNESVAQYRALGDARGILMPLMNLAELYCVLKDLVAASEKFSEIVQRSLEIRDAGMFQEAVYGLANIASTTGKTETAVIALNYLTLQEHLDDDLKYRVSQLLASLEPGIPADTRQALTTKASRLTDVDMAALLKEAKTSQ